MSRTHRDLEGQRFGRLVAKYRTGTQKGRTMWFCQCDCGNTKTVDGSALVQKMTQSCGCLRREKYLAMLAEGVRRRKYGRSYNPVLGDARVRQPQYVARSDRPEPEWKDALPAAADLAEVLGYHPWPPNAAAVHYTHLLTPNEALEEAAL